MFFFFGKLSDVYMGSKELIGGLRFFFYLLGEDDWFELEFFINGKVLESFYLK